MCSAQQSVTAFPLRDAATPVTVQVRPPQFELHFSPPAVGQATESSALLVLSQNQLLVSLIFLLFFYCFFF